MNSATKPLKPLTFFAWLIVGGGVVIGLVFLGTHSSLGQYIHLLSSPGETAAQLRQQQAAKASKTAACIKSVETQWNPVIKLAQSENLPVNTYDADEQQLINKCSST
jgi:hypothetical protein